MARVVRHRGGRFRSAPLSKHVAYLKREGVTRDGADARMFDATSDDADTKAFAERCEEDRHHFRFTVSPEDAGQMADLRAFARSATSASLMGGGRSLEHRQSAHSQPVRLHKELPGHVANRLQAALSREVYYLVSEGVVSAADADTACSWGPGLRWGIMGSLLLNHLGGGEGGIEHFFQQFTGPMTAWWKVLGQPVLTPEVQKKLIDSVHAEVGSRSIDELAAERDEMLLGLIELRTKVENASAPSKKAVA